MIKIEHTDVYGFEAALRGMRNPKNSWYLSDSKWGFDPVQKRSKFEIGKEDMKLAKALIRAGTDHSKFMRMITVSCDITAPMFWNAELDTYKIGTVRNSCSKMHKLKDTPIDYRAFSGDEIMKDEEFSEVFSAVIIGCERLRKLYNETGDKRYWRMMIELLPESFNQRYTWHTDYAVLRNAYHARNGHPLFEWEGFRKWIKSLPYSELITEA